MVHGTLGLQLVFVVIAEGENASVAATILGPSVQICWTIGEASALPRPAVIFDETAQRSASLVGTVALVRHFPLRRTPEGLTKTDLKGNHWDYGGVSTASATLKVYSRAGEVVTACEAPARYRRDLRTIVKGDVQGPKHRLDTSPLSDGPAVVILSKLKGVPVISARAGFSTSGVRQLGGHSLFSGRTGRAGAPKTLVGRETGGVGRASSRDRPVGLTSVGALRFGPCASDASRRPVG